MAKHRFSDTFQDSEFLAAMPENGLITIPGIAKRVGCCHESVRKRMTRLAEQGKVCKIEIIGGHDAVWQKVV